MGGGEWWLVAVHPPLAARKRVKLTSTLYMTAYRRTGLACQLGGMSGCHMSHQRGWEWHISEGVSCQWHIHIPVGGADFGPYLVDDWHVWGMGGKAKVSSLVKHRLPQNFSGLFQRQQSNCHGSLQEG